jgi:hypothetical protein
MATKSIRIREELFEAASIAGKAECRSTNEQISYWAKIGKACLENADLSASFVTDIFMGLAEAKAGKIEKSLYD